MTCLPVSNVASQCQIGLAFPHIVAQTVGTPQEMTNWCWAACLSGIFAWYGHPVSQLAFVNKVFGGIVNQPAVGPQIAYAATGQWIDANGTPFTAQADVLLDAQFGYQNPFAVQALAEDLANDRPVIVGSQGHATVITAMTYVQDVYGNYQITDIIVRDPWPLNPNRRSMALSEVQGTMFLMRVGVW